MRAAVNKKGSTPLKPELDRIAVISKKDQLVEAIAYPAIRWRSGAVWFRAPPDLHNASVEIADVAQGGLGLPDRDYYSDPYEVVKETREKYLDHSPSTFVLLGDAEAAAKKRKPRR